MNDGRSLFRQILAADVDRNWVGEPSAVLVSREALERVGLFNPRLYQIGDLDLWLRIAILHRVAYIPHALCIYRHHGASLTASNTRLGRDWLDRLWLLEGLLEDMPLVPEERAAVVRLRNAALRQAVRTQVGRLVHGRTGGSLPGYFGYRMQASLGKTPSLHDVLEPGRRRVRQIALPGAAETDHVPDDPSPATAIRRPQRTLHAV